MSRDDPSAARAASVEDHAAMERFRRRMLNPILFRAFLLTKVPLGLFAGMRLTAIDTEHCETTLPYGWRTTNPFRSVYFAAQSMAAELSTGALALLAVKQAPVSVALLIIGLEASFSKKADARITFTCADGAKIFAAVREARQTGEAATVRVESVGRRDDGTEVSKFAFTWSFKVRRVS